MPTAERLEPRLTLDSGFGKVARAVLPDGVDAMALGDVNADQVVDLIVAGRQNGQYVVTIYDGDGQSATTSTGMAAKVLATMTNPLGKGVGPLDLAVGDFNGDGVSDLAVSSTGASRGAGSKVGTWSFQLASGSLPSNAPVTPASLAPPFTPAGLAGARGLVLAAGDFDQDGVDELIVGAAGRGPGRLVELDYQAGHGWQVKQTFQHAPVTLQGGVTLAAGDLTGDGTPELVVGSRGGRVSAFDFASKSWSKPLRPLGSRSGAGSVRMAVVSAPDATGALVVTSASATGQGSAVLVPWKTRQAIAFKPVSSPGSGSLVPLGGGWLYPRSSIVTPKGSGSFPYSNGPVAPIVLLGATRGSSVVVQGFDKSLTPSAADTYVEPVLGKATSSAAFIPLQDASAAEPADGTSSKLPPIAAYPAIVYHSPYKIGTLDASVYNGLPGNTTFTATTPILWGPHASAGTPPTIPTGQGNDWLRQRVIAAYGQLIGDSYQHHHDPRWLPSQGSPWNVATLGYQTQGVDCTNLTAYAYKVALGISMNAETPTQAAISPTNTAEIQIPDAISSQVQLQVLPGSTDYDTFVGSLLPGDILYINPTMKPGDPSDPANVTHAITWLGEYGVDENGKDKYLIIDSTGKQPPHVDSNNHVVKPGVQIRPFGAEGTPNDWYFLHVDHVLRIIAN